MESELADIVRQLHVSEANYQSSTQQAADADDKLRAALEQVAQLQEALKQVSSAQNTERDGNACVPSQRQTTWYFLGGSRPSNAVQGHLIYFQSQSFSLQQTAFHDASCGLAITNPISKNLAHTT